MKNVVLLPIGLLIGAALGFAVPKLLKQSEASYPDALMTVLAQQMGAFKGMSEKGQCNAAEISRRLDIIEAVARDLDAAFLPTGDDARFSELSGKLAAAAAQARLQPPSDCDTLGKAMGSIGGSCKACHDAFK